MIRVPGPAGKDFCDRHLRMSGVPGRGGRDWGVGLRGVPGRDILRVGGSGLLGLSLGSMLELQAVAARDTAGGGRVGAPGWGKAKSIIMLYFQGGPSHIDL